MKRATTIVMEELDDYLNEGHIIANQLEWWENIRHFQFPKLSCLAKEYFCISATKTPLEQLFSVGRGIITYKRGSLLGETISMSLSWKSWAREEDNIEEHSQERDAFKHS